MKSLSAKCMCCSYKLYKIGLLIGFIYLIPNLVVVIIVFGNGGSNFYPLPILCAVTVITSLLLIKGLIEEKHHLLLPWMVNIIVLIIFNYILFMLQFETLHQHELKNSLYLQFGFFISLGVQIFFWYIIYCLLMKGYQKNQIQTINSVSQNVEAQRSDYYKVNLIANDHLIREKKAAYV